MFFMKVFLIVLCILMGIIGITFLGLYFVNKKRKTTDIINQKINLFLGIVILIGTIVTACLLPFLF